MNDKKIRLMRITAFSLVVAIIVGIVGYSTYLFTRGREEKKLEWGGAEVADILDDTVPQNYSLPFSQTTTTITYSGPDNWYVPASLNNNLPVFDEVTKRTGVKFNWQVLPSSQWNQSMKLKINGGDKLPDMIGIPDWGMGDINKYAKEKVIIPLNELINTYAPNIKRILKENPLLRKQMTAADGNIYSIDEFFSANHYDKAIIIRKDWLLACGYQEGWIPKTKAEFREVMEKFRDFRDADGNALSGSSELQNSVIPLVAAEGYMYDIFCSGFGLSAPLQDSAVIDGKVVYQRATLEYGEFLDWMANLYADKLLYQAYVPGSESNFEKLIIQNRVGISVAAGDIMDKYNSLLRRYGVSGEYIMINPPVDDNGNLVLVKRALSGGQIGITYDCKDPVTIIKLMDYLWANQEGIILMHYGLEGETYEYDNDGNIRFTEFVTNHPDGLDKASALRSIGAWGPLFDHQTIDFMTLLYPEQANEFYSNNLKNNVYVEPFPKILPTQEEANQTGVLSTNLNTYQSEYHMRRILGGTDQTYQSYLAEMIKLGVRQYEEYRQKQYDRFMAL